MKKSLSNNNLEILHGNDDRISKKPKLTLNKIESLKCDICGKQVKDYQNCISVFVYCNILCLEKLFMNHLKLCDGGYDSDDDKMMF